MIYDCFLFNNELEVLDIRLHVLENIVDKFVLTESTVTHNNQPKPLYFNLNKHKFKKFNKKIIHNIISDTPDVSNPWIINDFQFSQMKRGLKNANPEDVIIFGDLDEIPSPEKIKEWARKPGKLKVFQQRLSYYYLNFFEITQPLWLGTRMMKYRDLATYKTLWIAKYSKINAEIPNGGWHFSYMGGIKRIQQKVATMTHQEYNNDAYNTPEKIMQAIAEKRDFIHPQFKFEVGKWTDLPYYIQKNKQKFQSMTIEDSSKLIPFYFLSKYYLRTKDFLRVRYRKSRRRVTGNPA